MWISNAKFEARQANDIKRARSIFEKALSHFKERQPDLKEERLMLLENWLRVEEANNSDSSTLDKIKARFPKRVKKRRKTKVVDT